MLSWIEIEKEISFERHKPSRRCEEWNQEITQETENWRKDLNNRKTRTREKTKPQRYDKE